MQGAGREHPHEAKPRRKSEQAEGPAVCSSSAPSLESSGGLSGPALGQAGQEGRLGQGAGWPAGAQSGRAGASYLPDSTHSSIHASLSSRCSAEQTRMVSVAFPGPRWEEQWGASWRLGGLGVWGQCFSRMEKHWGWGPKARLSIKASFLEEVLF